MKIACFGDIHANIHAFEAVLEDIDRRKVDLLFNLGDSVGYGANPQEVLNLLLKRNILSIMGNLDRHVLKITQRSLGWKSQRHPLKMLAYQWTHQQLDTRSLSYLAACPDEARLGFPKHTMLLTHASPDSRREHLSHQTTTERLRELATIAKTSIVVVGHSHRPFARQVNQTWFVNTGSVGRPEKDANACWVLLTIADDDLHIQHHKVPYDSSAAVDAIRKAGLPEAFAHMISCGMSFDAVRKAEVLEFALQFEGCENVESMILDSNDARKRRKT